MSTSSSIEGALEFSWTEHFIAGEVLAVAADGDRFVAVGRTLDGPASWVSADGTSWDPLPVPPPTDVIEPSSGLPEDYAARGSAMGPLVRLDETFFSFGFFNIMDFIRPVGWRWADGEQWEPIISSSGFYDAGRVTDVVAGNGALVAARPGIALGWSGMDSTVWAWMPDMSWVESNLSAGDEHRTLITDLAWNDGQYLAAGFVVIPDETAPLGPPVVWTSADGVSWTSLMPPTEEGQLCAVEASPGVGFLALGLEEDRSVAWTTGDGSEWAGVTLPGRDTDQSANEPYSRACDLVAVAGHTLAVIRDAAGTLTWVSSSGTEWAPGPELPDATARYPDGQYVAAMGGTLVVVTHEYDTERGSTSTLHVGIAAP